MGEDDLAGIVGDNVKIIMREKKITNPQMAEILDISPSQVKKIKSGKCLLEVRHGIMLCRMFDINMERLYQVSTEMPLFRTGSEKAGSTKT